MKMDIDMSRLSDDWAGVISDARANGVFDAVDGTCGIVSFDAVTSTRRAWRSATPMDVMFQRAFKREVLEVVRELVKLGASGACNATPYGGTEQCELHGLVVRVFGSGLAALADTGMCSDSFIVHCMYSLASCLHDCDVVFRYTILCEFVERTGFMAKNLWLYTASVDEFEKLCDRSERESYLGKMVSLYRQSESVEIMKCTVQELRELIGDYIECAVELGLPRYVNCLVIGRFVDKRGGPQAFITDDMWYRVQELVLVTEGVRGIERDPTACTFGEMARGVALSRAMRRLDDGNGKGNSAGLDSVRQSNVNPLFDELHEDTEWDSDACCETVEMANGVLIGMAQGVGANKAEVNNDRGLCGILACAGGRGSMALQRELYARVLSQAFVYTKDCTDTVSLSLAKDKLVLEVVADARERALAIAPEELLNTLAEPQPDFSPDVLRLLDIMSVSPLATEPLCAVEECEKERLKRGVYASMCISAVVVRHDGDGTVLSAIASASDAQSLDVRTAGDRFGVFDCGGDVGYDRIYARPGGMWLAGEGEEVLFGDQAAAILSGNASGFGLTVAQIASKSGLGVRVWHHCGEVSSQCTVLRSRSSAVLDMSSGVALWDGASRSMTHLHSGQSREVEAWGLLRCAFNEIMGGKEKTLPTNYVTVSHKYNPMTGLLVSDSGQLMGAGESLSTYKMLDDWCRASGQHVTTARELNVQGHITWLQHYFDVVYDVNIVSGERYSVLRCLIPSVRESNVGIQTYACVTHAQDIRSTRILEGVHNCIFRRSFDTGGALGNVDVYGAMMRMACESFPHERLTCYMIETDITTV
jgi:hypothetical protein